MDTVMRRKIAMVALLGGLAAGLGCHHIAGKFDCGYNPSDYPIGPPTPPYPSVLAPKVPVTDIPKSNTLPEKSFDSGLSGIESGY
jgi:hypothetical protein